MPTLKNKIKNGFTLIEVVVALGILAVVFAGTVTLIVNIVNLELSARNKTEAVALAQKKMAETITAVGNGCQPETAGLTEESTNEPETNYYYRVSVADSPDYGNGLDNNNFVEVIVTVDWENRGNNNYSYTLKQLVRK